MFVIAIIVPLVPFLIEHLVRISSGHSQLNPGRIWPIQYAKRKFPLSNLSPERFFIGAFQNPPKHHKTPEVRKRISKNFNKRPSFNKGLMEHLL